MKQAYRILPVYTGDVSGVCSALYELGGMVVMHDPSGCNSTYNTHDETRWYDKDSLIFLSGLSEPDAVMGNDDKLIDDVISAAQTYHPKFIALCNSPIPYLNGTDFAGISEVVRKRTGIRTFYIRTNGMHDYVRGAGLAFEAVARELVEEVSGESTSGKPFSDNAASGDEALKSREGQRTVNILGLTPLDFAAEGDAESLVGLLNNAGWKVQSCWSMGRYVEGIPSAGRAILNLVVSSSGLRAAEVLRKRFGTPWVAGVPTGMFSNSLFAAMEQAAAENRCIVAYDASAGADRDRNRENKKRTVIIGEPVFCCSLAAGMPEDAVVICTTEDGQELVRTHLDRGPREKDVRPAGTSGLCGPDLICMGEEEVEDALKRLRPRKIIADPMYRLILPDDFEGEFVDMPHLAFSGRIYLKTLKSRVTQNQM